jgi:hypothetical protein
VLFHTRCRRRRKEASPSVGADVSPHEQRSPRRMKPDRDRSPVAACAFWPRGVDDLRRPRVFHGCCDRGPVAVRVFGVGGVMGQGKHKFASLPRRLQSVAIPCEV